MMKILYKTGSHEQVLRFYKQSKEERLKELEEMDRVHEKKRAEIAAEMSKHEVQR